MIGIYVTLIAFAAMAAFSMLSLSLKLTGVTGKAMFKLVAKFPAYFGSAVMAFTLITMRSGGKAAPAVYGIGIGAACLGVFIVGRNKAIGAALDASMAGFLLFGCVYFIASFTGFADTPFKCHMLGDAYALLWLMACPGAARGRDYPQRSAFERLLGAAMVAAPNALYGYMLYSVMAGTLQKGAPAGVLAAKALLIVGSPALAAVLFDGAASRHSLLYGWDGGYGYNYDSYDSYGYGGYSEDSGQYSQSGPQDAEAGSTEAGSAQADTLSPEVREALRTFHMDSLEGLDKEKLDRTRKRLMTAVHPDNGGSDSAVIELNNAYEVLKGLCV